MACWHHETQKLGCLLANGRLLNLFFTVARGVAILAGLGRPGRGGRGKGVAASGAKCPNLEELACRDPAPACRDPPWKELGTWLPGLGAYSDPAPIHFLDPAPCLMGPTNNQRLLLGVARDLSLPRKQKRKGKRKRTRKAHMAEEKQENNAGCQPSVFCRKMNTVRRRGFFCVRQRRCL